MVPSLCILQPQLIGLQEELVSIPIFSISHIRDIQTTNKYVEFWNELILLFNPNNCIQHYLFIYTQFNGS